MWKYHELLPTDQPVTLGEGQTPLLKADRLGAAWGVNALYVKDEGLNPTGSFKARGLGCAVTMLSHFGVPAVAIPTAGNAGSALAAYAAKAGIAAHIFAPADVPKSNLAEYRFYGANVTLVDGLISDCARLVQLARISHEEIVNGCPKWYKAFVENDLHTTRRQPLWKQSVRPGRCGFKRSRGARCRRALMAAR
jgi:threonine synthase